MLHYHGQALAPSTIRSREAQAEAFVTFMIAHAAEPEHPELYDILQYITILLTKCKSIQTVRNKLSGARTWVEEMGGDTSTFSSRAVSLILKGGAKASSHTPRRAPAITPELLKIIIDYLSKAGKPGRVPKAAFLIGYFTMLRQSNLLSPSTRSWGGPHTIRREDITRVVGGLRVIISSSKTIVLRQQATSLFVPSIHGSRYCPTQAWADACAVVSGQPDDPAFVTPTGVPLTPYYMTSIMRAALTSANIPNPAKYTLHGLRRGSAQACQELNVNIKHIMAQGTWKSEAVKTYTISEAPINAPAALALRFAEAYGKH